MRSRNLLAAVAVVVVVAVVGLTIYLMQNQGHPLPTPALYDIVNGNITVNARSYQYYAFNLSNDADLVPTVSGTFNVSEGETIRVYVMTTANFTLWQNQNPAQSYFDSGIVGNGTVEANLPMKGKYVLVYDNTFSATTKTVSTEVETGNI